ncbi:MAG: aldehyde dehydrogenase family protein [candidate division KSB1 bacterium]|jgi:succinate-semialdehyde dehydrogenase/glutarate-semialdehyde dehydrogenase|nr:aldehyde dehydrogenase family protein [candidate division KSB1 bacterium]
MVEITDTIIQKSIDRPRLNNAMELEKAVEDARDAQTEWAQIPVTNRSKIILKIRDELLRRGDEIADIISKENGKVRFDAYTTEILPGIMAVSHYCKNANKFLRDTGTGFGSLMTIHKRSKIIRIPYGVIGIISPWNYPFSIPFSEVITGILAGNAVILKVASETQRVGLAIKNLIESADIPSGLFSYINMPGRIFGEELLKNRIDKIFFTGSVSVGKILMEKASHSLTPLCLELGGNDPMIVCEDANMTRAVGGAMWAGYSNSGQSCGSVERLYLHESIYDEFLSLLKTEVDNIRVGLDIDFNVDMGAMTTQSRIDTVKDHIDDAIAKGAKIYAQSRVTSDNGAHNMLPATVLTDVDHRMKIMQEETFGPVIGVMKFSTISEALTLANDSALGLTASIWTKNREEAKKIARNLRVGVVTINDHLMSHGMAETPWGGLKESGFGRTHGKPGFDEMTHPLTVVDDLLPQLKKAFWWYPYSANLYQGFKSLAHVIYASRLSERLKALKKIHNVFRWK